MNSELIQSAQNWITDDPDSDTQRAGQMIWIRG